MLSLGQITEVIEQVSEQLEELVDQIMRAGDKAAQTEASFKADFATARLRARADADRDGRKITTDEAEDKATEVTQSARLAYLLAANNLTVLREALRARQARLDSLRTLAASHRGAGG